MLGDAGFQPISQVAFCMDVEEHVLHAVLGRDDLARQDARLAGLGVVLPALGRRKLVTAFGASGVPGGDHRVACRAFLGR